MRARHDCPDVRQAMRPQSVVPCDFALLLARQILCLAQRKVWIAVHLELESEDVVVSDLIGRQEGACLHVPDNHGTAGGHRLALGLEALRHVWVEDLPERLTVSCSDRGDLLVPRELCSGQRRDKLAVHVRVLVNLRERTKLAPEVLGVMDDVVIEAIARVRPLQLEDVPDTRVPVRAGRNDPSIVRLARGGVVGVCAQVRFGLVVEHHNLVAEAKVAVRRRRQLRAHQGLLELLLLLCDHQRASLLLLQVILQFDVLQLHVLAPIADANPMLELGATGKLLRRELHPFAQVERPLAQTGRRAGGRDCVLEKRSA
mmetsp:Transcript_98853/g.279339  ORF Transcript_98853/g.279339 Transcript_98853/m.279339 type:complete len:315 (+) Transcript_98853:218-1162(+)